MRKKSLKIYAVVIIMILIILKTIFILDKHMIGKKIDSYKGVDIYYNGIDPSNHNGQHYSNEKYFYGDKWQCVEFVKRFYYEKKKDEMSNYYANAKNFFDANLKSGDLNKNVGLVQYINGESVKPKEDDILVFTDRKYGHVAIVSKVNEDSVEIVQQNVFIVTREKYKLINKNGNYFVRSKRKLGGWLRKE